MHCSGRIFSADGLFELPKSYSVFLVFFLAACASQQPPAGGPKDETPPQVVRALPPPFAVNFSGNSVRLTFNEFITLSNPAANIYLSPAVSGPLGFRLRGKTLRITLGDSLRPSTTYTLFLGNAVRDLTEGNVLPDYRHVFSTGAAVDSLRVRGRVQYARTGKPQAGMLVMLHDDLSDSAVVRRRPAYFVRTDTAGFFDLNYLKPGTYRLFALADENQNYRYDSPSEAVAFLDTPMNISDTSGFFLLRAFHGLREQRVLQAKAISAHAVQLLLARPYGNPQVSGLSGTGVAALWQNTSRDTLLAWLPVVADSVKLTVTDGAFADTISVLMQPAPSRRKGSAPQLQFELVSARSGNVIPAAGPVAFAPSRYLTQIQEPAYAVLHAATMADRRVPLTLTTDSITGRQLLVLDFDRQPGQSYTVVVPDSLCRDVSGAWNDSMSFTLKVLADEESGNLTLRLNFLQAQPDMNYLLSLAQQRGPQVFHRIIRGEATALQLQRLPPARYDVMLVADRNGNGRWDTGDYWIGLQPEHVFLFPAAITIRPNWDSEVQIQVDNSAVGASR